MLMQIILLQLLIAYLLVSYSIGLDDGLSCYMLATRVFPAYMSYLSCCVVCDGCEYDLFFFICRC